MLHDFISTHRERIIARTREKVGSRDSLRPAEVEMLHGVPLFLDQLSAHLKKGEAGATEISVSASLHGAELLKRGLTIGQVVHAYGNICQAVTELAVELGEQITTKNFQVLNLCLDIAIAEAVTEYARQREETIVVRGVEHLGALAGDLRNLLNTAMLAFEAVHSGSVGVGGSTGSLIGKSLDGMNDLVSRSLAEVRLQVGASRKERVLVAHLLEEVEIAATMIAKRRNILLVNEPAEAGVMVEADSQILASIITNLVHNACKFTRVHGRVTLRTRLTTDRVLIDVADECGGLAPGKLETLFLPDQSHGGGLGISLRGAHAIGGELSARDQPGKGCIFTIELRRATTI